MTGSPSDRVLWQVHRLFNLGAVGTISDAELLDRFVSRREAAAEAAFEAIVIRHGPMVLRVCKSLLHDSHDAEDAFQAVFLVLANRARSIRRTGSVASWLFGVAHRVALHGRRRAARRRALDQIAAQRTPEAYLPVLNDPDWEILHEEIHGLPERLRAPIVLCYLQGLSYAEAAGQLGVSAVAIQGRLARARERLRPRLIRRGVTVPAALLAAGASSQAQAAVAAPLTQETVRMALGFIAGNSAAALARGVLSSMIWSQLRASSVLLCLALVSSYWAWHAFAATAQGNARIDPAPAVVETRSLTTQAPAPPTQPAPACAMTGTVRLEGTGEPVPGATITVLVGGMGQDHRAVSRTARSGADGQFTVNLEPGSAHAWTLKAPIGYWIPSKSQSFEVFTVSRDNPVHRKDYTVRRGTVWDFRINRPEGEESIPGMVSASQDGNVFWSAVDDKGRVRLTLPAEEGRVWANVKESLMAADWVPMTLMWQSGFCPDAVAEVAKLGASPGRYTLGDRNGKTATVLGTDKDKGVVEITIVGGRLTIAITVPNAKPTAHGDLTGKVVDPAGQPLVGALVALGLAGENGGGIMSPEDAHRALTDAHGDFRLRSIPRPGATGKPARIWLTVSKEGFAGVDTKSFRFEPAAGDATQVAKTVTLAPGVSLSGTVVGPDSKPLAGAWVEPWGTYADRIKFTRTDEAGHFTVRDLRPGRVSLRFDYGQLMAIGQYYAVRDAAPLKITLYPLPGAEPVQARAGAVNGGQDRAGLLARGAPAPEWESGAWSDGRTRKLADYRGKIVVLNFWGIGCDPSLGVLSSLEKLRAKYEPRGVVFLTIHTPGENEGTFRKVLEMKKASLVFAIDRGRKGGGAALDSNGATAERYGVRGYPTIVMIDRKGAVAYHSRGTGAEEGMADLKALAKPMGLDLDNKSAMTEADAHRLWEAYFDGQIEKILNRL